MTKRTVSKHKWAYGTITTALF